MSRALLFAGAAIALALVSGCARAGSSDDDAFGRRVRAYLLAHPEVLVEAQEKLQVKADADDAAQAAKARADLPLLRGQVERDPRDFVANPAGTVTVTEFYDYRCPHCANAAPKVLSLIGRDPKVRVVFKEMPIFGAVSQDAARAALAVKKAGGDYLGVYGAFMSSHPLDEAAIERLALAHGAKAADLADNAPADKQLADTASLFSTLDLGGTPAFIVGDNIIYGEDMDAVEAAVAKAEADPAHPAVTASGAASKEPATPAGAAKPGSPAIIKGSAAPAIASNAAPKGL